MDKHQPYREFEEDIPLPDQEKAWQLMKEKLEEDKKRRLLPPFVLNCAGWGVLLLLLMAGAWFIFKKDGSGTSRDNTSIKREVLHDGKTIPVAPYQPVHPEKTTGGVTPEQSLTTAPGLQDEMVESKPSISPGKNEDHLNDLNSHQEKQPEKFSVQTKKNPVISRKRVQTPEPGLNEEKRNEEEIKSTQVNKNDEANQNTVDVDPLKKSGQDSLSGRKAAKDIQKKPADSIVKKDSVSVVPPEELKKASDPNKKTYVFSAGLGLQQQIPFAGQSSVPYNYYGRKSSLSDYIPSIYARFEKKDKWFIMGEFRFGAPQSLKEFSFSRQTKFDTTSNLLTTTTMKLKKTYYHQLPLSFNYYVKPGWSVGAGAIYSRFYGAVTEREINNLDVQTQTATVTKQIARVQHFTDSFLYKTQLHFLLQTDVQWKRFNVGLRYTKDLQPYIRYTQPDGRINEEKNASFQLILRYRLWDSD